ncbi:MAG: carbohydrate ABC transporter permease [Salana multivorans]|uniref:carbohydrate ABC transporter permease n=1 Tax=Salana multivorans TaxID=120377 RepID=UPI0009677B51|nr:carbohydrate ABC transporter permease [Salana multivorans]MBN8881740.1 carbohydrate ABC transporter permease [Salana multivorans]OJX95945.1 MAG: ABC transporter permease [Micrococcales bacterium 73-15]
MAAHIQPGAGTGDRRTLVERPGRRSKRIDDGDVHPASRGTRVLIVVGLSLFVVYSVAPVWWLVVNSTKNSRDLLLTNGLWFADFNLGANLRDIFAYQDGIFAAWAGNSLLFAVVGGGVGTLVALAAGYGLAKFDYPGRGMSFGLVVASFLIPYSMLTLPLFLMFTTLGLTNTAWAVLIPTFINPFSVFLAKVYVEGAIPGELLEAARLDGAGEVRIFGQIVLRMLSTAAATVFLLAFVSSWNGFFLPITMLQDPERWTMSLGLYNWLRQSQVSNASTFDFTSLVITGSLLSVIPLAAMMILLQRFWRTGVSLGALK